MNSILAGLLCLTTLVQAESREWFAQDTVFAADNETQPLAAPVFYFVLHADPDNRPGVARRWARLKRFMQDLQARNQTLARPHRVSIMFTPAWGAYLQENPGEQTFIGQWYRAGHELAFHSHTHNHAYRDGYSNAADVLGPDVNGTGGNYCWGDAGLGECTLDFGLQNLSNLFSQVLSRDWFPSFAATGPANNSGSDWRWGLQDNSCNPALDAGGNPLADTDGCLRYEWTGLVAQIPYASDHYDHPEAYSLPNTAAAIQSGSRCMDRGDALQVYTLPHEPLNTESGSTRVSRAVVMEALDTGNAGHRVGVVIHPDSYQNGPAGDLPANVAADVYIMGLFADLESRGLRSVTLSTARVLDQYEGNGCW